jgi:hypothetical protein
MQTGQVTITTAATLIADTGTTYREIHIHGASGAFFVGGSTVTDATGYKIDNGDKVIFLLTPTDKLYGITSSATATCGYLISNR